MKAKKRRKKKNDPPGIGTWDFQFPAGQ